MAAAPGGRLCLCDMTSIREGDTGYLFEPGDKEDLKRALRAAYSQRQRWPEMGRLARKDAVEKHSWDERVRRMISQIEPILERSLGTPYPARRRS
jgi:glycosyltransferase involved in cell wall biosynthesis